MRGLPSCGKSHLARRIAGEEGVVLETDAYFEQTPAGGRSREELIIAARNWNYRRYQAAIERGCTPIVVDRGNGLTIETYRYVRLAIANHYSVSLREPDSEWWQELRVLLKYREHTRPILDAWADKLASLNAETHGVPAAEIREMMEAWQSGLTIDDIIRFGEAAGAS